MSGKRCVNQKPSMIPTDTGLPDKADEEGELAHLISHLNNVLFLCQAPLILIQTSLKDYICIQ